MKVKFFRRVLFSLEFSCWTISTSNCKSALFCLTIPYFIKRKTITLLLYFYPNIYKGIAKERLIDFFNWFFFFADLIQTGGYFAFILHFSLTPSNYVILLGEYDTSVESGDEQRILASEIIIVSNLDIWLVPLIVTKLCFHRKRSFSFTLFSLIPLFYLSDFCLW